MPSTLLQPSPRRVRITQTGEMWMKPGGRRLRFQAVEDLWVEEVAFAWRARFRLAPLIAMNVVDRFSKGEGELRARLFRLPVMRQTGAETSVGEALRYLAELPWVPHALRANSELEWDELDERTLEVSTHVRSRRAAVRLDFDDTGDYRPHLVPDPTTAGRKDVRPDSVGGEFGDYAILGGIRIPTSAVVYWDLPEGRFVYWRGRINALELVESR